MKKHTLSIFIGSVVFLLLLPIFLASCAFFLPAQYDRTFVGALSDKCDRLKEAEGNRLIVVGGSNVAFGLKSEIIEQELEYTAVNFGLYAAMGTRVMLDLCEKDIRAGDTVVLSPEQDPQTLSLFFQAETTWQAIDGRFDLLTRIPCKEEMLGQFPYFAARKCAYALSGEKPNPEGIYNRSSFNAYGDIQAEREYNVMAEGYDKTTPVRLEREIVSTEFIDYVNDWARHLQKKGAVVYYRFPPMNRLAVSGNADAYADFLQEQLDIPLLGDPNRSIIDPEWFYDTNFHLNSSGAVLNTVQLIRDLKAVNGDPSKTDIPIPVPPKAPDSEIYYGDDSHLDCFTYRVNGDAVSIIGMTEKAKNMKDIVIPTVYEGKQIVSIESGALENATFHSVTVQKNISAIGDFTFRGCRELTKILLEHTTPSACAVGQNLLEGTDAYLYVSKRAYNNFKVNYFWSVYASRIRTSE